MYLYSPDKALLRRTPFKLWSRRFATRPRLLVFSFSAHATKPSMRSFLLYLLKNYSTQGYFRTRDTLLAIPPSHLSPNPIISGTRLCLLQSLRYLAFVETSNPSPDSFPSFNKVLESNSGHRIGILSFSSGILPACVVSASFSTLSFITWAIEAYRLAFWIGIRCQIHRATSLRERGLPGNSSLPWSRVFVGLNEYTAREAIAAFFNNVRLLIFIRFIKH
jgi:Starter unit:ACP transacylase in aflatoxin biosynthesis